MRIVVAIVIGAIVLAAALAGTAPATLLAAPIASATQHRVSLADASGTVWHGRGNVVVAATGFVTPVEWHVSPLGLAWGELRGSVVTPESAAPAAFALARDRVSIASLALRIPARSVAAASGVPGALAEAAGTLEVRIVELTRTPTRVSARASIDWTGATIATALRTFTLSLGEVRAELAGDGASVPGTLSNTGGELAISGTLTLPASGTPTIDATVSPRPDVASDRAQALAALLAAIGTPQGGGAFRVRRGP